MVNIKALAGLSLAIDSEMINSEYEERTQIGYETGDSTYRHDGFSIGKDYLRLEGRTITRGNLLPNSLSLREMIGQGAFSQVYKAVRVDCPEQNMFVAVKEFCLLEASVQRRDMLLKELRALCQVKNECLVQLEGAYLFDDKVTMVLEFMDCGSLEDLLKRHNQVGRRLREETIASIAFQMLSGLSYLHQKRVIHRDVKPGNVLMNSKGEVKLCDFGLSSISDQSLQTTMVGTTLYMAPERLRANPYGRSSDLWSFGVVIFECFSGAVPWTDRDIISLLVSIEDAPFEKLYGDVPKPVQDCLQGCLQIKPEKRIPAIVLVQAPWLQVTHGIKTVQESVAVMIKVPILKS